MLGPYDSIESRIEYQQVLALLKAYKGYYPFVDVESPAEPNSLTVDQVILAWWKDAERRYGAESAELNHYKYALRHLRALYGQLPAANFSPKRFKDVRQRMVEAKEYQIHPISRPDATRWIGEDRVNLEESRAELRDGEWTEVELLGSRLALSRNVINRHLVRIRAVFGWAVSEELIPAAVAYGLREVKGICQGNRQVKENRPRPPAFWDDVTKVAPYCPPPVAAMLQLQWLTGMRSGEVRIMRTMDIDRSDPQCWTYRPGSEHPHGLHKNAWRGQDRIVPLGPQCIDLLIPWLRPEDSAAYVFSPSRSMAQRQQQRAEQRKSKRQPSQAVGKRRQARPKRKPNDCYSKTSYPQAVKRACDKAGIMFHPYGLRHGRKMVLTRTVGSDAARAVLGQKSIDSTEHYGEIDAAHAQQIMKKLG